MRLTQRALADNSDLAEMLALACLSPRDQVHWVDLPYRLASWALDEPQNAALWHDGRGRLQAWAVLQAPFWAIDFSVRPAAESDLVPRILDWAGPRAESLRGTPHALPAWYVQVFSDQDDRRRALEQAGFACQENVGEDSWSRVLLERIGPPPPMSPAPSGFAVRPLAGPSEVGAYVMLHREAFETKNMSDEWRARTLTAPHHRPESDLVIVAPGGRLTAFCIGWLSAEPRPTGQIEPLGVARESRERGLGRAILTECVRSLAAAGAETVLVETDTYRSPALELYESVGFKPARDVLVYRRDVAGAAQA